MDTKGALLTLLSSAAILASCDDNTDTLGIDIMPSTDFITKSHQNYGISTESYAVGDSVLARSSMSYLGRFTDPETGTMVKSDFLAQFHCLEGFAFPDSVTDYKVTGAELKLYVEDFVGDSLTNFKLSVYPLNKVLDSNKDYYTNIDPTQYYDKNAEPIAVRWFTLSDHTISDSERWSSSYYNNISIPLPDSVGQAIYDRYRTNPSDFENTGTWINSGLPGSKGFYFKIENGDGAIAYIDIAQFNIHYRFYDTSYAKDTTGVCQFSSTEEVVQATRFENSNISKLMEDTEVTYIKSPAGIFTMATLPIDEISQTDSINSAKVTFTRYNSSNTSKFQLGIPKNLLLVRLDEYKDGFFEKYKLNDDQTSYVATFNSSKNTYTFNNIARLISKCIEEKKAGTASETWNKVLLIPVELTYDTSSSTTSSSSTVVKISHDFSMSTAKLVGGDNDKVNMEVIYTKFGK